MSFYSDASLVLIPSGYKDQKVYSAVPTDGSGDLSFTRASSATRVASNGLIEKVRTNIALRSQSFATSAVWSTVSGTITDNAGTAPDGTNTASKIVAGNADPYVYQSLAPSAQVTLSCYVKGIGSSIGKTARIICNADLTDVTMDGTWQRISVTHTPSGTEIYGLEIPNPADVSDEVLLWGFQVEYGDIATDYIATTSAAVSVGPVSGLPRLDYLNSTCPRLLLEPQRTNLLNYSEQFNSTPYWDLGSAATITANSVISPDGTLSADTLTANGTGSIFVRKNVYMGTAQTCSNSIFAKKANHSLVGFRNSGTTSAHDVFNFDTKTWTNNSGATLSYDELDNGWFRLKSTNTDAVNLNYYWSVIPAVNTSGDESTTASNLSVYIWGGQAEQNAAYCTSYIPTLGTSVTRVADDTSKTGISSLIGQTNGTFFVDVTFGNSRNNWFFSLASNSWLNDAFYLEAFGASNYIATSTVKNSAGAGSATSTFVAAAGVRAKIAVQYTSTTLNMFINGVKYIGTRTATPACTGLYLNQIGTYGVGDSQYNANRFNQVLTFTSALTDAQCIELTT
jgi:hypothetical protein